jgi:CubicO group peptidase (beta-lactamase class C family)
MSLPFAKPEEVGMSSERLRRLSAAMLEYIDTERLPGVVTLISRYGKVVHFEAHGERYAEKRLPMTKDTIFFIASMTKPITSVALMTLYEEGKFLLDDPISTWIPEYSDMVVAKETASPKEDDPEKTVPAKRPITVRHLLTNTAGLSTAYTGLTELGLSENPDTPKSVEEAIKRLASRPLESHPGDAWKYRNSAGIAGVIVEKISGMTLDEFFKVRIFDPLGMRDTHFNVPESKVERVAAIYRFGREGTLELIVPPKYYKPHTYFSGSGGLSSTATDYWRFHQMILNGGELDGVRILGPKTVDLMITNHIGELYVDVKGSGYGFGLGYSILLDPGQAKEPLSPGSFGWGGTFNTYFWVDPAEAMIAIMMAQVRPSPLLDVQSKLSVLAMQAIIEKGSEKAPTIEGYQAIR